MMIANTLPNSDRMAQIRIAIRELEAQEQLVLMEELANLLRRRILLRAEIFGSDLRLRG